MMSKNFGSSKFFVTVLIVTAATVLSLMEKEIPETVFAAALVGYHAANAYIKGKRNGGDDGRMV